MRTFLDDLRLAVRLMLKAPVFTVVAVATLGLGIGASTAMFSLVNGALLKPLPVRDPGELVWLTVQPRDAGRAQHLSWPDYVDYRDGCDVFSGLLGYARVPLSLSVGGHPERLDGVMATSNYFAELGLRPTVGRFFSAQDDGAPVAVISHALWRRTFKEDPSLPGRTVTLNGQSFVILGVAPEGFSGTEISENPQIWVPIAMHAQIISREPRLLEGRDASWLHVMGRLGPGVSLGAARAAVDVVAARIAGQHKGAHEGMTARVSRVRGAVHTLEAGEIVPASVLLLIVTGVVLLIACANVGNLLLGRSVARRREMGIRLALGASRGRLVSQLLVESFALCLLGSAAGMLVVIWAGDFIPWLVEMPPDIVVATSPDWRVLAFALGLAMLSALASGLPPAMHASRPDVAPALRDEPAHSLFGRRRSRLSGTLVVAQVALSLVLLVCAGLFLRSVGKALAVNPGFDTARSLTVSFDLGLQGYPAGEAEAFYAELLGRVEALPGVSAASLSGLTPLSGKMIGIGLWPEGADEDHMQMMFTNTTRPGYFRTLGIALSRGRDFTAQDAAGAPDVAIVSEMAAHSLWPDGDALGRRVSMAGASGPWLEVVGIAAETYFDDLTENPRGMIYLPHAQHATLLSETSLLASTQGDPAGTLAAAQQILRSMNSDLPLFNARTLTQQVRDRLDAARAVAAILSLFGALALVLASMGLYGMASWSVSLRTREIGIRMALGAAARDVLRMLVGEGVRLAGIGIATGLVLSLIVTRMLSSLLFGVGMTDVPTFAAVSLLLAGVAAAASYLPARRATRIDPVRVLRQE